jgi:hypothetical protein
LFEQLASQQQGAVNRLEIAKVKNKVMARYQSVNSEVQAIERQEREALRAFSR